jgi:hypothetical protein
MDSRILGDNHARKKAADVYLDVGMLEWAERFGLAA